MLDYAVNACASKARFGDSGMFRGFIFAVGGEGFGTCYF